MYSSNESKERKYVKENKIRYLNDAAQQQIVDDQIAEELGFEKQSSNLGKLAKRVVEKFALSDTPKITKNEFSDKKQFTRRERENLSMASEDVNIRRYPKIAPPPDSKPRPTRFTKEGRKYFEKTFDTPMENLNQKLMSDEDTLSSLTTMNADQDYALREKFDNLLDGVASEAKSVADKRLLKRLKILIEKQSMADAFQKWSDDAIQSAFADKIKRNLKMLLAEKKLNQRIALSKNLKQKAETIQTMDDLLKDVEKKVAIDINRNKAATTIQQRMAELRARKASKARSLSDSTTEQGTLADVKMDARHLNPGAPKNDTNAEFNKFSDLLIQFDKSSGTQRKYINKDLNNIISRQRKINPKIADRMKTLKSALHKK